VSRENKETNVSTTRAQGEGWYEVGLDPDEKFVPAFTDEILDHPEAGNWAAVLVHWIKRKFLKVWTPADPENPDVEKCCEGTVESLSVANDGDIVIRVIPDEDCRDQLLDEDESLLVCELPWSIRNTMRDELKDLRPPSGGNPGTRVRICGHWIIDHGHDEDHRHELHPVTALLPMN
jgi:hypothetical protein